jgi:hypothetical protein
MRTDDGRVVLRVVLRDDDRALLITALRRFDSTGTAPP